MYSHLVEEVEGEVTGGVESSGLAFASRSGVDEDCFAEEIWFSGKLN